MASTPHISPRIKAYGKARIDITRRAKDEQEWQKLWKGPTQAYPFTYTEGWKFNIVYIVDDYAAEVGFFIDLLGFPVLSFSPSSAQFTSPSGAFTFGIAEAQGGEISSPPETLRLQFNLSELESSVRELEQRGVTFDQGPEPIQPGSTTHVAVFRTPHGVPIELWGEIYIVEAELEDEETLVDEVEEIADGEALELLDNLYENIEEDDDTDDEDGEPDEQADRDAEVVQPTEGQSQLWQRFSNAVSSYKAPLSIRSMPGMIGKGNGELTYTSVESETLDLEEDESEEDFP